MRSKSKQRARYLSGHKKTWLTHRVFRLRPFSWNWDTSLKSSSTTRLIHRSVEDAGLRVLMNSDGVAGGRIFLFFVVSMGRSYFSTTLKRQRLSRGTLGLTLWRAVLRNWKTFAVLAIVPTRGTSQTQCRYVDQVLAHRSWRAAAFDPAFGFRTISKQYVDTVSFYVYGDKYALIPADKDAWPKIVVVKSTSVAESFRHQFFSCGRKQHPDMSCRNRKRKSRERRQHIGMAFLSISEGEH